MANVALKPVGSERLDDYLVGGDELRARLAGLLNATLAVPGLATARRIAPFRHGQLRNSISVRPARVSGGTIEGALEVGVEYGRRQEFEHPSQARRFYLLKSARAASEKLAEELRSKKFGDRFLVKVRRTL